MLEVGRLSTRGKCASCAHERIAGNHIGLVTHRGPFFEHWRRRSLAALGVMQHEGP